MSRSRSNLRWSVERRLEFIEYRLYWEGRINRGDLMETFGVSVNQASTDLNQYLRLAPENMVYHRSARAYLRSSVFSPLFLRLDADRYLSELRSVKSGMLARESAWLLTYPEYDEPRAPARNVSPETLRVVLDAMRNGLAMEIRYQSLSHPEPRWRWIAPHAIGFDGFRWHVRAFCEEDETFKDFLLARVVAVGSTRPGESDSAQDLDWHEFVNLEIGPHPALSRSQRTVVALDYGMRDGRVVLPVRRAFLYYVLKRLGLDRDALFQDPADQQIVLLNRTSVEVGLPPQDGREQS